MNGLFSTFFRFICLVGYHGRVIIMKLGAFLVVGEEAPKTQHPKFFHFVWYLEICKFSFICNYIFFLGLGGKLGGSRIEEEYIKRIGLGASSKKFEKIPTQNFGWCVCPRFDGKSLGE